MPKYGKRSLDKKQNKRLRRLEKKIGGIETKSDIDSDFNTTDGNTMDVFTAAIPRPLGNVSQGDTAATRTGNRIQAKYLDFMANVNNADVNAQQIRLVIFYWKQDKVPVLSDIFTILAASGWPDSVLTPVNPISLHNKYLHVLYDRTYYIEGTTQENGTRQLAIRFRKRVDKPCLFIDAGAAGDMRQGFYYVIGSTANNTYLSQACRLDFTDL